MATHPTVIACGADGKPLERDEYAAMLAEQADPSAPGEGDRVRLTYDDGSTVTGRWEFVGGGVDAFGLLADDGRVHTDVTSGVRREVLERVELPRLALLNRDEALVVARLLEELGGVYDGEQLGLLAQLMANRVYDRLGI
jgi:8-oxo-dGTP pyrophosphatase MutT (NUDIX family)